MASLVSPGLSITVTDETQYVSTGLGTVPLVFVATAQDKTGPSGSAATGTSKAKAGALQAFGSQRDLITAFGYPTFQQDAGGGPVNGGELNEYGLQAAYSALGLGSNIYIVRADVDLNELVATAVRPVGAVDNGTEWLDLSSSSFGIFVWNASTQTYSAQTPLIITSTSQCSAPGGGTPVYTPLSSVGTIGQYAVVVADANNPVFYKTPENVWVPIGTTGYQQVWPTVQSSLVYAGTPVPVGTTVTINATTVTITGAGANATLNEVVTSINSAFGANFGDGIQAGTDSTGTRLVIYADSTSMSDGTHVDGEINITTSAGATSLGLTGGSYYAPLISFGTYTQVPTFATSDSTPAPTGSLWIKTTATGGGAKWAVNKYNSTTGTFVAQSAPIYQGRAAALYGIDYYNGGTGITVGSVFVDYSSIANYPGTFKIWNRYKSGMTQITGAALASATPFTIGDTFTLAVTQPGTATITAYPLTIASTTASGFVTLILGANIQNVSASISTSGAIVLQHAAGGDLYLVNTSTGGNNPILNAGFSSSSSGILIELDTVTAYTTTGTPVSLTGTLVAGNWAPLSYTYSATQPYVAPANGTHWYYSDVIEADIMICTGSGWQGYGTVTADARGYNLTQTDPNGPIFTADVAPELQTTGSAVVAGDLWVDTGDLENYPKIYRYNGTTWVSINNTDQVTQNGIVFADARWDASLDTYGNSVGGIIDPVAGSIPVISTMKTSNYVDLDAPAYQLYPRGTLLWNTRRNGFNVKQYVGNAFTTTAYPNAATTGTHQTGTIPTYSGTWQTVSGENDDGTPAMGHYAQRAMVIKGIRSAIDSSTQIREDQYSFQLIAAPGYPEAVANMTALNNDRVNTAFIVGDTPFDLKPNTIDITDWSNNVSTTADIYTALYYPSGQSNDLLGNTVIVPPSHMALRTFIHSDNLSYPWFAPAGARRGLVDNATAVGYVDYTTGLFNKIGVSHSLRDTLYTLRINPITVQPNLGLVVWGQKTRSPVAQSTDRVNVSRLVNYIRTVLSTVGNGFMFEPNDTITRAQIKNVIEGVFNDLVAKRGIYDYSVVCDDTNNTPDRISRNELYVDVAIAPVRAVEFIYIPIRLVNPGQT